MAGPPDLIENPPPRMLPAVDDGNREFWAGGARGLLLIRRCPSCQRWALPKVTACQGCGGPTTTQAASGKATLLTWTTAGHQFHPDVPVPYLVAIVVLVEQDDLRLATNLVGCTEDQLRAGAPLEAVFEQHGEVYFPVFRPVSRP